MEEPFFFDGPNGKLFALLHRPAWGPEGQAKQRDWTGAESQSCSIGIVFCSPFAEEKLWAHRVFVNFGRLLAERGIAVLRFDYMGTGDSAGATEEATVETHLADIGAAAEELRKRARVRTVGLLGLRFGATLALLAVRRRLADADFLILWHPILKGEEYLQKCLRSHLATQMAAYKKILKTRAQILAEIAEGKPANIEGYLISSEFYRQAQSIDLLDGIMGPLGLPALLAAIRSKKEGADWKQMERFFQEKIEKADAHSQFVTVGDEAFWTELKDHYEEASELFERTYTWICKYESEKVRGIHTGAFTRAHHA
ncbi:MAG: alpha/beta hydrolase [candidate division WOR-3 bacterium]